MRRLATVQRHLSTTRVACADRSMLAPAITPASPGLAVEEVPTPALLLDLQALEQNCASLNTHLAPHADRVRARPHAKAFKSSALAKVLPFERFCCQTVREAEAMVTGGVMDVLVTNQVLGEKLPRLAALAASGATVGALVDASIHVTSLNDAAVAAGVTLTAYVEINGGQNRCGVEGGSDDALRLAQEIIAAPALEFGGLQCYHGAIQHVRDPAERRAKVLSMPVVAARATVDKLAAAGIACPIVSGGGTGTFLYELEGGVHTEIQPGSFLFMDGDCELLRPHCAPSLTLSTCFSDARHNAGCNCAGLRLQTIRTQIPLVVSRSLCLCSPRSSRATRAPLAACSTLATRPAICSVDSRH